VTDSSLKTGIKGEIVVMMEQLDDDVLCERRI
jgi:hypothetical protein